MPRTEHCIYFSSPALSRGLLQTSQSRLEPEAVCLGLGTSLALPLHGTHHPGRSCTLLVPHGIQRFPPGSLGTKKWQTQHLWSITTIWGEGSKWPRVSPRSDPSLCPKEAFAQLACPRGAALPEGHGGQTRRAGHGAQVGAFHGQPVGLIQEYAKNSNTFIIYLWRKVGLNCSSQTSIKAHA